MIYNITDFGAVADRDKTQTYKIQSAIDSCYINGGGTVVVPEGLFITGGILLRSNVTLLLKKGAILKGTRDPKDYFFWKDDCLEPFDPDDITDCLWSPASAGDESKRDTRFISKPGSSWNNGLIRAYKSKNIAIIGEEGSVIDGSDCYDADGEEHYRGPHLINMWYCDDITFKGYTALNSSNWAHSINKCTNIKMDSVTCIAGHDGIHCTACDGIDIKNCVFKTGDDCVAGFDNTDMTVNNCVLNTACSGLRFGGTRALIENCEFYGPAEYVFRGSLSLDEKINGTPAEKQEGHRYNMLSMFTYYADLTYPIRNVPGGIVFKNCTSKNVDRMLHYNFSGNEPWQKGSPLKDVSFISCDVKGVMLPLSAYAKDELPFDLTIKDCDIEFSDQAKENCFIKAHSCEKIIIENSKIMLPEGGTLVKSWGMTAEPEIITTETNAESVMVETDEEFVVKPI